MMTLRAMLLYRKVPGSIGMESTANSAGEALERRPPLATAGPLRVCFVYRAIHRPILSRRGVVLITPAHCRLSGRVSEGIMAYDERVLPQVRQFLDAVFSPQQALL